VNEAAAKIGRRFHLVKDAQGARSYSCTLSRPRERFCARHFFDLISRPIKAPF